MKLKIKPWEEILKCGTLSVGGDILIETTEHSSGMVWYTRKVEDKVKTCPDRIIETNSAGFCEYIFCTEMTDTAYYEEVHASTEGDNYKKPKQGRSVRQYSFLYVPDDVENYDSQAKACGSCECDGIPCRECICDVEQVQMWNQWVAEGKPVHSQIIDLSEKELVKNICRKRSMVEHKKGQLDKLRIELNELEQKLMEVRKR